MVINHNTNFGTHNTSKRIDAIKYIVVHYVGATGDAKANIDYYNQKTTTNASADFFVGHKGAIWQYNPEPTERYTWAVGGRKNASKGGSLYGIVTNKNSISVEMCVKTKGSKEANSPDWYFTEETVNSTIELVRYLMGLYKIPKDRVIRHYDVNGKLCPGVVGWNEDSGNIDAWERFKVALVIDEPSKEIYRVRKTWKDKDSQIGAYSILENAKRVADANPGYNVYDSKGKKLYPEEVEKFEEFMVRVKITNLNIRKGPGYKTYPTVGVCPVGSYTIVETKIAEGYTWGRLKSGAGWIALEYTERV